MECINKALALFCHFCCHQKCLKCSVQSGGGGGGIYPLFPPSVSIPDCLERKSHASVNLCSKVGT